MGRLREAEGGRGVLELRVLHVRARRHLPADQLDLTRETTGYEPFERASERGRLGSLASLTRAFISLTHTEV